MKERLSVSAIILAQDVMVPLLGIGLLFIVMTWFLFEHSKVLDFCRIWSLPSSMSARFWLR